MAEEVEAWRWRRKQDEARSLSAAWHTAVWTRIVWEDVPALSEVLAPFADDYQERAAEREAAQAAKDQDAARAWNAAFAGVFEAQERRRKG